MSLDMFDYDIGGVPEKNHRLLVEVAKLRQVHCRLVIEVGTSALHSNLVCDAFRRLENRVEIIVFQQFFSAEHEDVRMNLPLFQKLSQPASTLRRFAQCPSGGRKADCSIIAKLKTCDVAGRSQGNRLLPINGSRHFRGVRWIGTHRSHRTLPLCLKEIPFQVRVFPLSTEAFTGETIGLAYVC